MWIDVVKEFVNDIFFSPKQSLYFFLIPKLKSFSQSIYFGFLDSCFWIEETLEMKCGGIKLAPLLRKRSSNPRLSHSSREKINHWRQRTQENATIGMICDSKTLMFLEPWLTDAFFMKIGLHRKWVLSHIFLH